MDVSLVELPSQPTAVEWPTRHWPRWDSEALDPQTTRRIQELDRLADQAFGSDDGAMGLSLALVVVQGGRILTERYGPTAGPDHPLISWSMAKSFAHALVGVAVRDGLVDPAKPAAVGQWSVGSDDPRSEITLLDLLSMSSGLVFNEDYVDAEVSHCIEMLFGSGSADVAQYAASLPMVAPRGEVFNYSSGTTNIICRVLADLVGSGSAFESWMRTELLKPLGIESSTLKFDEAGTWIGSSFLYATARDFAKFGLLYLRDGVWDGRRILPSGWVDHARTPSGQDDEGKVYGAHWWIWDPARDVFAAQGYETQRILVDPGSDSVVVRLGKTPPEGAPVVDEWLRSVLEVLR